MKLDILSITDLSSSQIDQLRKKKGDGFVDDAIAAARRDRRRKEE